MLSPAPNAAPSPAPRTAGRATDPHLTSTARGTSVTRGLLLGVLASLAFGTSGAFIKPMLEAGWSPAAAVTVRAGLAALALAPFAIVALRGNWASLWRARWRILGMGLIGVAATQLAYFAAIQRIPVSTALLIEYLAPLLLVGFVWATTRRMPRAVVLAGSVVAIAGLALVIGPSGLGLGSAPTDALGLLFAGIAAIGVAVYYVVAARPSDGLPPVAFAAAGLLVGSVALGLLGVVGVLPLAANFGEIAMFGTAVPWWMPMLFVALVSTALAYVASVSATAMLGSRLMSFVGLLEVVFASLFAWLLLGEALTPVQLLGGVFILGGIVLVRMERAAVSTQESAVTGTLPLVETSASPTEPVLTHGR